MSPTSPIRLVTTNNVDVYRLLGAPAVARLGVDYTVAADQPALIETVRQVRPRVALIDAELAGGSGYEACRAIKDDPALASTHVVLLLAPRARMSREVLALVAASGCDDVMALPLHPDDFYFHIAHLTGLPFRRDRRIGVDFEVAMPADGDGHDIVTGTVVNVGTGGVGIHTERALPAGQRLPVRFGRAGQQSPETQVLVAWSRPVDDGFGAGLQFVGEPPVRTRLLLEQVALFDVVAAPSGPGVTVILHGDFTEITSFAALRARLGDAEPIDFDLASVRYLSSAGVRAWCQFLAGLGDRHYEFRHCSVAFVSQAAMVPMVLGHGQVLSLEAPYVCDQCDHEELRLLENSVIGRDGDRMTPPRLNCTRCGGELTFDDVPDRYFAFLRED
jgi:CheY-like chemotaxis protein